MTPRFALAAILGGWFLCAAAAEADTFTFEALPSGTFVVSPGDRVGWGYSITNESAVNWLVTTALNANTFLFGTPDASLFDFPVLAPGETVTVLYDPDAHTGLYAFTADPDMPPDFLNMGFFVLSAEFWTADPRNGGMFVSMAPDQSAEYSVTSVPEPSFGLLEAVMLWSLIRRRRYGGAR